MEGDVPTAVDVTPDKDGGCMKEILKPGCGEESPLNGDRVTVHYVGTLESDGSKFDSSRDRGDPFQFNIGKGEVIKGWDTGVATMKRGEVAKLRCQPEYAYGEMGSPPKIPANAVLIFEVELLDWEGEDISDNKDQSIVKSILTNGEGYQKPNDGASVEVHLIARCDGTNVEERDVAFVVGEGSEQGVVPGVEESVKNMMKGETARVTMQAQHAYGAEGNTQLNIPPNAKLVYDIHLKAFEKAKESWEMETAEKLEQAEIIKQKGTAHFKAGKYKLAITNYKKIVDYLNQESEFEGEEDATKEKRKALLVAAHLNLAMCFLKVEENASAQQHCNDALDLESQNVKGLYRRGQALFNQQSFQEAKKDFEEVVKLDPSNKAAKNQVTLSQQKIAQAHAKEKKLYAGMFDKFAKEDAKRPKESLPYGSGMNKIEDWNNDMAKDMMSLEEEMAAFGEKMPERKNSSNKENIGD